MSNNTSLPIDYQLNWYRIKKVLGRGGFGITYLAQDTNLDKQVAIKEFFLNGYSARHADHSIYTEGEQAEEMVKWGKDRFITEANTLRLFNHPNIVKIHSIIRENNTAYIVMTYEQGRTLSELIKENKKFSEEELNNIILPLLDGLELMHNQGFIHRDIKPGNIFIRNDKTPVLIDFGSARFTLDDDKTLTQLVTPGYAPYEQYHGKSDTQGPWTDIYSLGATIYQVITGNKLLDSNFRAGSSSEENFNEMWSTLEKHSGDYSVFFLRAIEHALRSDREERPQTVAEWRKTLTDPNISTQTQWRMVARNKTSKKSLINSETPFFENSVFLISIIIILLLIIISLLIFI
ncbi:MAG: serine/threonine protein kinase [Proteobacteria bacterium]|nr:serine/threonine protein kinase [Pseudomonadota bacterium]